MAPFNRRFLLFLLLDAAVLAGLVGFFFLVRHILTPVTPVSQRLLATPEPAFEESDHDEETPGTPAAQAQSVETPDEDGSAEAEETKPVDLKRLRAVDVKVAFHKIKMGENYWIIASNNKISINTLIGANPDLPFRAKVNQELKILSRNGVLHTVKKGETLAQIAAIYKTDDKTLKAENGVTWWKGIREGDVLFIPDVKPIYMVKAWKDYFGNRGFFGIPFAGWGKGWTSGFGYRVDPITGETKMHKGMDFKAKWGESVFAAASGKVVFTGVAGGYGNLIKIHHPHGYLTYYGHLSKILTTVGHKVRRGELIGKVGATGRVTGPHLHFEIRKDGKAINPLPLI